MDPLLADIDPSVAEGDEEHSGGYYRCRDDISNFRIKVRVRKVVPTSASSVTLRNVSTSEETEDDDLPPSPASSSTSSTWLGNVTLAWQEKLFSPCEENYYRRAKEEDFQGNVLKKKFFRDVQDAKKRSKTLAQQIFTCLDGELYQHDEDKILPRSGYRLTTNPDEEPNYVSLLMADGLRRRNVGSSAAQIGPVHDKTTIPTQNVVNYVPTRENQLKLHTLNNVGQAMVIRLALDSTSQTGNDDEGDEEHYGDYLDLCVLKYGANGVLEVSPDFTNNRKPYTIELEHKKETFEYWIEHVSPLMDYDEQLRESVMQNEVFARHVQVLRQEVGDDFEKPPGRSFRLFLNGEIVSAEDFDHTYGSCMFVHYFLELPMGWSLASDDTGENQGLTQTCYIRSDKEVAHFGHPFCLDLYFDTNRLDKNEDKMPKWPQLFFEVISLDQWSRCRTEGYGNISIPIHAGCYDDMIVETWRPILPTSEMRRYFIGGTPELEDLSYCGGSNSMATDSNVLSRYGFCTMTSGRIRTRMYVMHQSKALMPSTNTSQGRKFSKKYRHHLMDRLASATLFSSLGAVMEAFKKARERIAHATKGYDLGKDEEDIIT